MHELSVADNIVEIAVAAAVQAKAGAIAMVRVRLGALAGVHPDALRFCFDVATQHTMAAGARLEIVVVPVVSRCSRCERDVENAAMPGLCPVCGAGTGAMMRGKELEVESIEVVDQVAEVKS